jgi:hypothetical protein
MSSCPSCGTAVAEESLFCHSCGCRLDLSDGPTGTAPRPRGAESPASPRPTPRSRSSGSGEARRPPNGERFAPGDEFAGRYRIVGLVGRGGMGEVYQALDLKLEQTVALKFLPPAVAGDAERIERLYGEVRTARQVSHPAVCRVFDVGEAEGQHFLSMEFVDGENLSSLLRRIGRFPVDKALDVARQVAAGLAAAHEKGVLHRDLKPANVMLDGQGKVRLTDFGLAGLVEDLAGADVRSGTPSYMSPEQLLGREVTVRSDIYSFGLLVYELVTGRRAFDGRGLAELTRRHRDDPVIEPSLIVPDLPPAVERTILACLEKEPKRRPSSALVAAAMLSGRDPLEAVIAAGETPSPELVAAAGESEGLRPRVAAACLGLAVIAVLAVPPLYTPLQIYSRVPVEKSPAALEDRARELLARLGHNERPADEATGLGFDTDYLLWVQKSDRSPRRWDALRTGEPPVARFWYRGSPRPLAPMRPGGPVTWLDPPALVSGMTAVQFDLTGRLVALSVVPPQIEPPPAAAVSPDWSPLFEAAQLDPTRLREAAPRWTPPFHTDAREAWDGTWPHRPEIALHVEAAAYRGRPVWFRTVSPWTRAEREEPYSTTAAQRTGQAAVLLLFLCLIITGAVFAKRNIRLGRGDRRGAFRLALALAGIDMTSFLIRAHHVTDTTIEITLLARAAGMVMLVAGVIWLFYLALEPYVRKLRPWTLISWARLLSGGFRDAVVGRDVLIGMVWGGLLGLVLLGVQYVPPLLGHAAPIPNADGVDALLGTSKLLSRIVGQPVPSTLLGLGSLLLFLVLRLLTRRDSVAAALLVIILAASMVVQAEETAWITVPLGVVVYGSYAFILLRFGVLSAIAGAFTVDLALGIPLFTDLGRWTGSATPVVVPLLILIAVAAFRSAIGGHSGLRRYLAADSSSRPSSAS